MQLALTQIRRDDACQPRATTYLDLVQEYAEAMLGGAGLAQDAAYLERLDQTAAALGPYWDRFPAATFGEVEAIYLKERSAA